MKISCDHCRNEFELVDAMVALAMAGYAALGCCLSCGTWNQVLLIDGRLVAFEDGNSGIKIGRQGSFSNA